MGVYRQIFQIYLRIAFIELDAFCKFCRLDKHFGRARKRSDFRCAAPKGASDFPLRRRLRHTRRRASPASTGGKSVPPDFLGAVSAVAGRRGLARLHTGVGHGCGRGGGGDRRGCDRFGLDAYFIATEVTAFGSAHFRHGGVGLRIIVIGIPEKKADATFLFRYFDLNFNILGRISPGAPGEGLQPGANYNAAVFGDEHEAVHGLADEMLGRVAGAGDAVHAEEVRGIDHGREHVTVFGHGYDVLPGVRKINGTLPRHDSKDIEREQGAGRMDLGIGALEEIGDHFRARRGKPRLYIALDVFRLIGLIETIGLKVEGSVFLIALGGKANVVELHFVDSGLSYELGECNVIVRDLGVRGVGPDQLAIFAPRLAGAVRLHREFRMVRDQMLIAKDGDASDGVHVLRMQEANELGQVGNIVALSGGEGVVEGNVDDAVAILNVEYYRVAADFAPMADDAHPMIAARHHPGQVNGADFEISCNWDRFLYNCGFENSGDDDLLSGFEEDPLPVVVGFADGCGEFQRGEVFCSLQIFACDRREAVSALGDVKIRAGWRNNGRRGFGLLGGISFYLDQLHAVRILYSAGGQRIEAEADQGQAEHEGSKARD